MLVFQIRQKIIVENLVEFMNSGYDDFGVSGKRDCQIFRRALIIHDFNLPAFMLYAKNRLL
jgi:hypothetical protein